MRAAPWAVAEAVSNALSGVASIFVAGWLLTPADIGRAGIVIGVVMLIGLATGLGIQESLIRHRSVHASITDTAFTGLMTLGGVGFAVCWLIAAPIGWFFDDPALFSLLGVTGFLLLLNAVMAVPTALLTRKMRANVLTRRMMLSRISQVVAIGVLGYFGAGAWAMVGGVLISNALSAIVLWRAMPRVPRLHFDWGEFRTLASFGGSMSIELLLWQGTTRIFALQVGYFHGVVALGYFQFAQRVVDEVGNLIQANIVRFGLSFFADLDRNDRNASRAFLTATSLTTVAGGVLFIGVALVANDLVPLAFGPGWQPAAPLIQIFAAAWFFQLSRALAGPMLRAKGHQMALVLYGLVACLITLASGFVTAEQALVVVVLGWSARNLVSLPWSYLLVSRYARIPVREQLLSIARPLAPMAAMTALVLLTQHLLADAPAALRLAAAILVGMITAAIAVPLFNWRLIRGLRETVGRLRVGGTGA